MGLANDTDGLERAAIERRRVYDGYTVIEVPERRDYWFGNVLVLEREPAAREQSAWVACHARRFRGTGVQRHVIVWEGTGEREAPPVVAPDVRGKLERTTVFVRREPFAPVASSADICELRDAAQWETAAALSLTEVSADDPPGFAEFERWRFAVQRAAAHAGRLRMWGSFVDGELAAFAGAYATAAHARFATPVTRASQRRRGFFRALCATVVNEALRVHPGVPVVICATTNEAPAALYRRLGFSAVGEQYRLVAELLV